MLSRDFLAQSYHQHPELFPQAWEHGFTFHDSYQSKKTAHRIVELRRLQAEGRADWSHQRSDEPPD